MKAIMVMFDSLNRRMLEPYGCDWVKTPNFKRLAERTVKFTRSYIGSVPCMPARREIHTGRYNFLHRSWGPMEPFDDSMPEILKKNGVHTHLASDHYHYWEDGGCTYHTRYSTWEFFRGQEGDPWTPDLRKLDVPHTLARDSKDLWHRQDWINRCRMCEEEKQPQPMTFTAGIDFLRTNRAEDNWFLTIETFDPHEPYFSSQCYKDLYPHEYNGPKFDWPPYRRVEETPEEVEHMRYESAALHSMCDAYLGKILDLMDELDLWKDTMLIVNTDHGFLLGEHNWWAKVVQPWYQEVAHTPLFIWDPRSGRTGETCDCLVQTIDLTPTILEYFGVPIPETMQGRPLKDAVASNMPVRDAALFGVHGGHINCTDGRYVYMRAPANEENRPLFEYTMMPTHMRSFFSTHELQGTTMCEPFTFTKGCPIMKIPAYDRAWRNAYEFGTMLFDLESDPNQDKPIQDASIENMMIDHMVRLMKESDAPVEQYERMGLRG